MTGCSPSFAVASRMPCPVTFEARPAPASAAPPVKRSRRFMLHLGNQLVDIHEIVRQVRWTDESRTNALRPLHRRAGPDRDPGFAAVLRSRFAPGTSDCHRGGRLDR